MQKQEKLDKLNELITSTNESAKSIAKDMSNKLELLKVCYERSSSKQKNKVHELTNYSQLICYLTGKPFSNSYETKPIELKHLVYTERSINKHIENGLPKNNNEQAIEIYSFYFGGYRAFFRCFTKEFLELRIKQKKEFLDDIFSQKNIDSEETALNQYIEPCQKLNIIPSIEIKESILRIDILENLFNRFQNNKKVAISGISGIGKTFLAKHFTEHYQGKFSNMVWLNCANGFPKAFSQEKGIGKDSFLC
jgi:flagellar biosynthesis GTPase FlhF